ncbi:MAG: 1-hydroxycarotenoid 3,4-desaturase CrtD [Bacteroidota bacterium]
MKIGVIGAGIGGLATAARLASRGHEVQVFEANAYPGGKLSEIRLAGYRFDAGPSLFTMPHYVEELFKVADVDIRDYFQYEALPLICQYFWEDGTELSAYADVEAFGQEIEKKLGVASNRLKKALHDSERKYDICGRIFLEKSLHRLDTWTNWEVLKAMLKIPTLDIFSSMDQVNRRQLKHPKLVQLFNRFATYNGSSPYKAPGLLNIIPHFEHGFGAFFPKGGMHAITQAIYRLALDKGVRFHFNQKVDQIEVVNRRVEGLMVNGERLDFDQVVSNMDVYYTYKKLLPNVQHPEKTLRQDRSTSALIFYWGIQKTFPQLQLHNILFSDDYAAEFKALNEGRLFDDPTVYINITQKCQPEDAPEACENWFTMINVPHNNGQDWTQLIKAARARMIQKISRILNVDIAPLIACEQILDPRTIESKTSSYLGALYGTSSNNRMAAFMRHPNFSRKIDHLYFCGGSVHPGGGIPLCLLSAKIVDELLQEQTLTV